MSDDKNENIVFLNFFKDNIINKGKYCCVYDIRGKIVFRGELFKDHLIGMGILYDSKGFITNIGCCFKNGRGVCASKSNDEKIIKKRLEKVVQKINGYKIIYYYQGDCKNICFYNKNGKLCTKDRRNSIDNVLTGKQWYFYDNGQISYIKTKLNEQECDVFTEKEFTKAGQIVFSNND